MTRAPFALFVLLFGASASAGELRVSPAAVVLNGPESTQQLLVGSQPVGPDLTHRAKYAVANPAVARVTATGLVEPKAEGKTELVVTHDGGTARVPVEVHGLAKPMPVSFEGQIIPLLTKASCNSGGCHGKAEGQNGFKLSVFGFDPEADHKALVAEGRGRRVLPSSPANSILVLKATGRMPHGGGRKIAEDTLPYKRLVRWIAEGSPFSTEAVSPVVSIAVEPAVVSLPPAGSQQLRVTVTDAKGQKRCVTAETEFDSNVPGLAGVDRGGRVRAGTVPGEAAILVRYMGHVTVCRVTVPRAGVTFPRPPEANVIDKHVWDKLAALGIPSSDICDDATFLRRAYLDVIGTLPTAAEARAFLADTAKDKRAKLIDKLLERLEYADFWAMKWADLLRVDRDILGPNGAVGMTRWLRKQFAYNAPYDRFARDILTAEGKTTAEGPAGLFKALAKPEVMSRSLSQLFLGVRIECAQCHHHPSDKWGQDDYLALAGFFTGVSKKVTPGGEMIVNGTTTDLKHPRTGKPVPPRALGSDILLTPEGDRRAALAEWVTSPANPYFARAVANRLWAHYFGRGLIEPLDDLRATNPAANEPLLDALAKHLVEKKYDLKAVMRLMLNSRVYQLSGPTKENADDEQNFSHVRPRGVPAEVLLDAICQATGVPEKFVGLPEGVRAIQLWDNRMPSYFLTLFGRPARVSVCECERSGEPSIAQALHLRNAPEIEAKIRARRGVARQLANSLKTPDEIIDELTLATLSRFPTKAERAALGALFDGGEPARRAAVEDALWALMNTKEFLFNH